jgi:hypothetical protein
MVKWLVDKNRREILALLGTGVAAIAGGLWATYTYFQNKAEVAQKIEATYKVCVGADRTGCPANSVFLVCGTPVAKWASKECASYSLGPAKVAPGGMCGYSVVEIKCTSGK